VFSFALTGDQSHGKFHIIAHFSFNFGLSYLPFIVPALAILNIVETWNADPSQNK